MVKQRSVGLCIVLSVITCGIYGLYWLGEKLDQARAEHGAPTGSLAILYLVLNLFGLSIVTWALIQSEINKYVPAA